MANVFTRMFKYLSALLSGKLDEVSDPKIQLEQAIREAQSQHLRLKEQAANVIANQKQTELRLDRVTKELDKLNANAQQALLMAEEARGRGDTARAAEYEQAAETIATKLITVEQEVRDLEGLHLEAVKATDQAKQAVQQNAARLQEKLAERQKLLSQLDQAKMTEQMNEAMASLNETVGRDVPSFEEVRAKIEQRQARAQGKADLHDVGVDARVEEIERATRNVEAHKRLSELRSKLGLSEPETAGSRRDAEEVVEVVRGPETEPGTAPTPTPPEPVDEEPASDPAP